MPHGCAEKVFKNQINVHKSCTTWRMNSIEGPICALLIQLSMKLMELNSCSLEIGFKKALVRKVKKYRIDLRQCLKI